VLTVVDTRWRWKYKRISGYYNIRDDNQNPKKETIKNARQLGELLFKALGVKSFDLGDLPADQFPEKDWDCARADAELSELLDATGCIVVPVNATLSWRVVTAGVGSKLPKNGLLLDFSDALTPPERPDQIVYVAGRTLYQTDFELEAVGEDTDGSIKQIDKLSFKPAGGWSGIDIPHFMNVDADVTDSNTSRRELARRFVFKLFRIKTPFRLPEAGVIEDLKRILPITDRQVFQAKVLDKLETLQAYVYGQYYQETHEIQSNLLQEQGDLVKHPAGYWYGGTQIIAEKGLVLLSDYCRIIDKDGLIRPPKIKLRTSVNLRDAGTFAWQRRRVPTRLTKRVTGAPSYEIVNDEVAYVVADKFINGRKTTVNNWQKPIEDASTANGGAGQFPSLKKTAEFYTKAAIKELELEAATSARYGGFVNIPMDGAIRAVEFVVDESGKATTMAHRNSDGLGPTALPRSERVFNAKVLRLIDNMKDQPRPNKKRGQ
jgi:hypothetical protein